MYSIRIHNWNLFLPSKKLPTIPWLLFELASLLFLIFFFPFSSQKCKQKCRRRRRLRRQRNCWKFLTKNQLQNYSWQLKKWNGGMHMILLNQIQIKCKHGYKAQEQSTQHSTGANGGDCLFGFSMFTSNNGRSDNISYLWRRYLTLIT